MGFISASPVSRLANGALGTVAHVASRTESWALSLQRLVTVPDGGKNRPLSPEAQRLMDSHPRAYGLSDRKPFNPERSKAIGSLLEARGITTPPS